MREKAQGDPPSWSGRDAQALIQAGDVGGLLRWSRTQQHHWTQAELGTRVGYSTASVSRLERTARVSDLNMLRAFATALAIPPSVLGAVLRISPEGPAMGSRVEETLIHDPEEDSMLRRTLLAAGLTVPASLLLSVDDALADIPSTDEPGTATDVRSKLADARKLYDKGQYAQLIEGLPDLLAVGHAAAAGQAPLEFAMLAACYDIATEAMSKIGRYDTGRITADRSTVYANLSGSPLAAASSSRMLSVVLRHRGETARAARITLDAADKVQATGLITSRQTAMYAQMLASCSYTAAGDGDRTSALELIAEAEKAAARLPGPLSVNGTLIGPHQVALYKVGTLWALGDAGSAIDAGRHLKPGMFPTAERRARLHTDMGRAWWSWDKPAQTAESLMAAFKESPQEVRDRPAIRGIVNALRQRHLKVAGVRELVDVVTATSGGAQRA